MIKMRSETVLDSVSVGERKASPMNSPMNIIGLNVMKSSVRLPSLGVARNPLSGDRMNR